MTITKSKVELTVHTMSKHCKTFNKCFPGANIIVEEMKVLV
jgi:hypothetical protein